METRASLIKRASVIALVGNALLAAAKLVIGLVSGSLAVLGDGIDSSTDVVIAIVALLTARIVDKPGDREHPYGHSRAETVATTLLSFIIGGTLGVLTALKRGWLDQVVSRVVDAFLAIPVLIFALMLLAVFGKSIINLVFILALLDATRVFRLARAAALDVVVMDYVEAAKLRGEKMGWIIFKEVLPNILPPLITEFGLRFCFVFLTIAALSFLGVGIQPPTADWGSMVAESKTLITFPVRTFPWIPAPFYPAIAIALLTVAINFVVDWFLHKTSGLRDEK